MPPNASAKTRLRSRNRIAGGPAEHSADADDPRDPIEASIECEDLAYVAALHDRDVQRVAGRQLRVRAEEAPGSLDVRAFYRVDDVDDRDQRIEGRIDVLRPADGRVAEDLLQDLGIGAQRLAAGHG